MARTGDVIEHPLTGERLVFLKTAAETNGELLQIEMILQPGGGPPAEHVHPNQDEYFKVLAGTAQFRINGKESTAKVGDWVVVPRGATHVWWNTGDAVSRTVVEFRPALRTEEFFESFWGLAQDGKMNAKGLPTPLRLAVLFIHYMDEVQLAIAPRWVQRALFSPLALVGRLRGYRGQYRYPYPNRANRESASA